MTEEFLFGLALLLLAVFDLCVYAIRAAYQQTSHGRLLNFRDQAKAQINSAVQLTLSMPRLTASLNLLLVLTRTLTAGLVVYFISRQVAPAPANAPSSVVLASALALLAWSGLLFLAEFLVERRVLLAPEPWAIRLASLARVLMSLVSVLLLPLGLPKETPVAPEGTATVTEEELRTLVDAGQEEGVFELGERRMIYSIMDLGDTLAREIMVPRIDMVSLEVSTPLPEAVDTLLASGHSRIPVFAETVDNMLGLLYAKDLLRVWREGSQLQSLRDLLRPAYYIPEAKRVPELLAEMQSQRVHMAIVVDEYGGVAGLVTLEDIVEEVLGEIRDEYDTGEEAPYQALKNGDYLFLGRVDLDDFNEIMNSNLPKTEADTLGGYIYSQLGRVPDVGESVRTANLLLTVEQVSAHRIRKVRARWLKPEELEDGEEKANVNG